MSIVRIKRAAFEQEGRGRLHGAHLDAPNPGTTSDVYSFEIEGWALGKSVPVFAIELLYEGRIVLELPVTEERPEIAERFPGVDGAARCGFRASVGVLDLRPEFELVARARHADGTKAHLGEIQGSRRPLRSRFEPGIQPLVMNQIGRSGTTWLAVLLSRHPEIVAFRPFSVDARVATYWMSILQDLSQPNTYLSQFSHRNQQERHWWLGDEHESRSLDDRRLSDEGRIKRWLGRAGIESLAAMCQGRIERFYAQVEPDTSPRYFVEKFDPTQVHADLLLEIYPQGKEVFLVRDFRDRLTSVLAFNAKRGYAAFGRETTESDVEYVRSHVRSTAFALLKRWRERGQTAHLVRYEDLVLDPAGTLLELLRYLEADASEAAVRRTLDRATEPPRWTDYHRTASDFSASIGRWRRDLPDDLAELCEEELGPALAAFGYDSARQGALQTT